MTRLKAEDAAEQAAYAEVTDPRVVAVIDVLAPVYPDLNGVRIPQFEFPHETTPTPNEVIELAQTVVAAIDRVPPGATS